MIPDIKDGLKACYEVHDPDLKHLLLSPRARIRENDEYLCCSQCHRSLQNDMLDKLPPKFAIANNFAIGLLPDNLSSKINEITSPMLSPVRPYAYVLSYCGGAHKAISGSFSFFNQSPENLMGSLKFHSSITKTNNGIYLKDVIANIKDIDNSKLIVIAPQINNDKLVSTGNDEFYAPLFNATNKVLNLVDYIYVQNYNTAPEQNPDFIQNAYTLTKDYIGAKTAKIVIGYPTADQGGGATTVYFPQFDGGKTPPNSSALETYDAMKSVYDNLGNIPKDTKFAGFMGWSLNVDYVPSMYNSGVDKYPDHGKGDFGYYMSPCALDSNKCSTIREERPIDQVADVLINNNSTAYGFDGITFTDANGKSETTSGWIGTKTYNNNATAPIETSVTVSPIIG